MTLDGNITHLTGINYKYTVYISFLFYFMHAYTTNIISRVIEDE